MQEPIQTPNLARCMHWLDTWHECIERQSGWLVFGATLLVGISIPVHLALDTQKAWPFWAALSVLLLTSIVLFTRPLDDKARLYPIFRFAWGFVGAAVVGSGVLLYTTTRPPLKDDEPEKTSEIVKLEARKVTAVAEQSGDAAAAPSRETEDELASAYQRAQEIERDYRESRERRWTLITVVHGCDYHSPPSRPNNPKDDPATPQDESKVRPEQELPYNPAMPEGVYCGELPPQWVISIGGSIMKCHFDGTCPRTKPPIVDATKLRLSLKAAQSELTKQRASLAGMDTRIRETRNAEKRGFRISGEGSAALEADQVNARSNVTRLEGEISGLESQLDALKGWTTQSWNLEGAPIVGGIVVPVYFVVMTIIGSIIGLFRKLPEFQERVEPDYPAEYKQRIADGDTPLPPISPERARELVVFQILQVVFAAPIGILAYSYARPEEIASTVVLAFGAGFSSELILVAVRATVDRLIGLGPRLMRVREAGAEPAAQNKIPPPGPVKPEPPPPQAGGFKVGDRVTLVKPVGVLIAGSQGIVMSIGEGGLLSVRSTEDNTGMPVEIMLEARPADFFRHASQSENSKDGPAG